MIKNNFNTLDADSNSFVPLSNAGVKFSYCVGFVSIKYTIELCKIMTSIVYYFILLL